MDLGVGKHVEEFLIRLGYDVITIRSINPQLSDLEILQIAALEDRMIITRIKILVNWLITPILVIVVFY